jgi:2-keto-4-pentenoate hydratase/2-oxohepta-3-ene-1,7-dioic acid hydratase in catechol pathway
MRLISYRDNGHRGDALGVVVGDRWLPAAALVDGGSSTMAGLLDGGPRALEVVRAAADPGRIADEGRPLDEVELLAPVPRPGKVVAIGRNYREARRRRGRDRRRPRRSSSANGRARSSAMAPRSAGTRS